MADLHTQYAKGTGRALRISEDDEATLSYLEKQKEGQKGEPKEGRMDERLEGETRFQVFYNLSELRTGLISWYDFPPDADILEIGAGFGALTGYLCGRCAHVTATERSLQRARALYGRYASLGNLDVYAGDVSDMAFPGRFDIVLLVGVLERAGKGSALLEPYAAYLRNLLRFLKPEGRLLAAVENRFGLRYFCGAAEPHTNHAFEGLMRYPSGTSGVSFSRKELEDIAHMAGLGYTKFYYPLPDYRFPQLIYTDAYLPGKNLKERLIPYYRRNDTLVASELELYQDVTENGVFPFFANSFLLECGCADNLGKVAYAAVSTDRGREQSYATTIRECPPAYAYACNGKDAVEASGAGGGASNPKFLACPGWSVQKRALYPEGRKNAALLYARIRELENRGVPVVPHTLKPDGTLEMPYVDAPTLSDYIKDIIRKDTEEFERLVDRLYRYILQSSDISGSNALAGRFVREADMAGSKEEPGDKEKGKGVGDARAVDLDFGPILKRAFLELIPLNCFYIQEEKRFLFFDQEFVREDYPAKYVLFRAIHYIYCFTPDAEHYYPKRKLIEAYEMEDTWDVYLDEEKRFLDEVRNHKRYRQFYQWAKIDQKRMLENSRRLESEEETIAGYRVSGQMKQIWRAELAMLDEVVRICGKYGLTYFLVHGSLLGAVRHQGFIPWDDDLDIAMPRADYDRFLSVAERELPEPFSIHTFWTEKDLFWGGCAKIRDGSTTGIEPKDMGHDGNLGIWIDVLPLDVCTANERKLRKKCKKIRHYHRLFYAKAYGKDFEAFLDMAQWKWRCFRLLSGFYSHRALCRGLERAMRMYTEEESEEVAFFTGYGKPRRLYRKDFETTRLLEFERRKVPAPAGYASYLFMMLGKDYMKYPPKSERRPKHRGIFDPEKPYTEYQRKFCGLFRGMDGKQLILFGSGLMFEDYMGKYGKRHKPDFLVDNDQNKWGRTRMGVDIRPPDEILAVPEGERRLVICSFYYKEIEKQLERMGVRDYKVYVQKLEWVVEAEEQG